MPLAKLSASLASPRLGSIGKMVRSAAGRLIPSGLMRHAVEADSLSMARRLLGWGYPIESRVRGEQRALHHAVFGRNALMLAGLLAEGADPQAPGRGGLTALHQALWQDRIDVIQPLLAAGANPNQPEPTGEAPLLRALIDCPKAVGPLLRAGADPKILGPLLFFQGTSLLPEKVWSALRSAGRDARQAEAQMPLIVAALERQELLDSPSVANSSAKPSRGTRL